MSAEQYGARLLEEVQEDNLEKVSLLHLLISDRVGPPSTPTIYPASSTPPPLEFL